MVKGRYVCVMCAEAHRQWEKKYEDSGRVSFQGHSEMKKTCLEDFGHAKAMHEHVRLLCRGMPNDGGQYEAHDLERRRLGYEPTILVSAPGGAVEVNWQDDTVTLKRMITQPALVAGMNAERYRTLNRDAQRIELDMRLNAGRAFYDMVVRATVVKGGLTRCMTQGLRPADKVARPEARLRELPRINWKSSMVGARLDTLQKSTAHHPLAMSEWICAGMPDQITLIPHPIPGTDTQMTDNFITLRNMAQRM